MGNFPIIFENCSGINNQIRSFYRLWVMGNVNFYAHVALVVYNVPFKHIAAADVVASACKYLYNRIHTAAAYAHKVYILFTG